jgi:hypothetical protein
VIIGADANDTNGGWSGSVYIYFGGLAMDRNADVIIKGLTASEALGFSVSSAGDVNNDGYDDVIAGADQSNVGGNHRGRAFIYFGGSPMNNVPDVWLPV